MQHLDARGVLEKLGGKVVGPAVAGVADAERLRLDLGRGDRVFTVLNGVSARVTSTSGAFSISTTGTKSFEGSKVIFGNTEGLTVSGPIAPMPSV